MLNPKAAPSPANEAGPDRGSDAATLSLGALDERVGFHLRLAHAAVKRDFVARLADLGLTQAQAAVLELVDQNPGVSQVDIAAALDTDRATMMALVDKLQGRGLTERRPSKVDRRRQTLHLMPAGKTVLAQARRIIEAHERSIVADLSEDERLLLIDMLHRLIDRSLPTPRG